MANVSFEKAMKLAVLSGLKVALGPAFLMASQRRPETSTWAAMALGEMVLDKVGILPSRSSLPLLIPHSISGAWVARESMMADGIDDPMAAVMGGAVAAGVSTFAPMVRIAASRILGVPDPVMGLLEDYLALKLGTEAVGLSMDEVTQVARHSVEDLRERVMPAIQSAGAGSM
jgi:hypothetical protein